MGDARLTIHVVDDDAAIRDSLSLLLSLRSYNVATFASAEAFLDAVSPDWTGCIVADIRMPGMSGLELQHALVQRAIAMPVLVLTAHGDVDSARAAFKAAAVDFIEKPFDDEALVTAIEGAFTQERARLSNVRLRDDKEAGLALLTPREREVMDLVVLGRHNREIGEKLGISPRTVEIHRARVMEKLGADNLADLIRISRTGV